MKAILFCGYHRTGKSTAANILARCGVGKVFALGIPLREFIIGAFNVSTDLMFNDAMKDVPTPELNWQTPRQVMDYVGESIRLQVPTFWLDRMLRDVKPNDTFILSDCRSIEVAEYMKQNAIEFMCIRMHRGTPPPPPYPTQNNPDTLLPYVTHHIQNDGGPNDLYDALHAIFKWHTPQQC